MDQTEEQKKAKKREGDRRYRANRKADFKRLQKAEVHLTALVEGLQNQTRQLGEHNEWLMGKVSNLEHTIHELHLQNQQLMQESIKTVDSFFDIGSFPSPNEEVAIGNSITQLPGSSQFAIQYSDELVEDFIKKLYVREKSNVSFSDFEGLRDEIEMSGINSLPPSLAPIDTSIKEIYGDFAADGTQSSCTAMPSHIVFCAAIKEMQNLSLQQIDERKILLWRDAINSVLNINFKVEFAIEHLKQIARAYFGLKALSEQDNVSELWDIRKRISELEIEKRDLEGKYAERVEERSSEIRKQCVRAAEYFDGYSLCVGLLY
ncbi:hypothetical protein DITRI_Ditri05aG0129900 [Diplodiscus trichospermus]